MATDVRGIDIKSLPEKKAPRLQHELRIAIDEDVFDHAVARGNEDTSREVGGVLVGKLARDVHGPFLHIDASIDALHAEEKGAELTFTHETWDHIHREMDGKFAGSQVVGWWHTHPGFGVFLSDRDQFIHKSFFDLPFQIALVYDPKAKQHGVFAWRNGEALRSRQYWIGEQPHVWDADRATASPDNESRRSAPRETTPPAEAHGGPSPDWVAIAIVGVIVAIGAGLLGWWLGGSRGPDVRQIQAQMMAAESAGAQRMAGEIDKTLISLWRQTMDRDGVLRELDAVIRDLERAEAAPSAPAASPPAAAPQPPTAAPQPPAAAPQPPAAKPDDRPIAAKPVAPPTPALSRALDRLRRLRQSYADAASTLAALENAGGSTEANAARREIAGVQLYLGNLYAELAADAIAAKDKPRARRYLIDAASVDPANRDRYEKQLRTFDRTARLPAPPAGKDGTERERGANPR